MPGVWIERSCSESIGFSWTQAWKSERGALENKETQQDELWAKCT